MLVGPRHCGFALPNSVQKTSDTDQVAGIYMLIALAKEVESFESPWYCYLLVTDNVLLQEKRKKRFTTSSQLIPR